jgi:hypothetical protein
LRLRVVPKTAAWDLAKTQEAIKACSTCSTMLQVTHQDIIWTDQQLARVFHRKDTGGRPMPQGAFRLNCANLRMLTRIVAALHSGTRMNSTPRANPPANEFDASCESTIEFDGHRQRFMLVY